MYEHFPSQRPGPTKELTEGMGRTAQWKPKIQMGQQVSLQSLHFLRIQIDNMTADDVSFYGFIPVMIN